MYLSPEDAKLFFKLMFSLQFYVAKKLGLLPDVKTQDEFRRLDSDAKLKVRDIIYENPTFIDEFIEQNPDKFNKSELAIVHSWKKFIKGNFYIERFLKKYSIWINEEQPAKVYGVLGLTQSLDEIVHPSYLPLRVHAVLLPWKGKIIYDGIFQPYNVFFGSGIKSSLREEYMTAKQNGRILETLDTSQPQQQEVAPKPVKDWGAETESLVQLANIFKGKNEPLHGEVFSLLKAVAALTQTVVDPQSDLDSMWKQFKKVERAANKMEIALHRAER